MQSSVESLFCVQSSVLSYFCVQSSVFCVVDEESLRKVGATAKLVVGGRTRARVGGKDNMWVVNILMSGEYAWKWVRWERKIAKQLNWQIGQIEG